MSAVVFYNSIRPFGALAGLVTAIAMETMSGVPRPDGYVVLNAGIPILAGEECAIFCDSNGVATHLTTTESASLTGHQICTGIYLGSAIYVNGKLIGNTMLETMTTFNDGKLIEMSGQTSVPFGYRRARG